MASVYSSFEIKLKATDDKPQMKGLNHFQLLFAGDRWWIISNTSIIDTNIIQSIPIPRVPFMVRLCKNSLYIEALV